MPAFINFPDWIKPEIISGFPFLRWYSLMYLVGFSITYILFKLQIKERKLDIKSDQILNFFFIGIIGLLIGARLFAVTIYDKHGFYLRNPLEMFLPFSFRNNQCTYTGFQGMSYHGGLVGLVVALIIYWRIKKIDILSWCDMIAVGVPLGYFFGRIGNFINGELYGRVTTAPWGIIFPNAETLPTKEPWVKEIAQKVGIDITSLSMVNLPRHPSQLYEAFFEGIFLWIILWVFLRKKRPFKGFHFASYIIGYGIVRFFIEYTRRPDVGMDFPIKLVNIYNPGDLFLTPWNFSMGQILCFFMILGGGICMYIFKKRSKVLVEETSKEKVDLKKLRKKIK